MLRLAAVLALVLATTGPLDAQAPRGEPWRSPEWRATVFLSEAYAAVTTCVWVPLTWTRSDLAVEDSGTVAAHEADHRAFLGSFPSCEAFYAWRFASRENAIEVEGRAFCAGARHDYARGKYGGWIETLWVHATSLAQYHWLGITSQAEALAALVRHCAGPGVP